MVFKLKKKNIGDLRIKRKFLVFPCRIGDEIRWLEKVSIAQVYCVDVDFGRYWDNIKFLKTKEEENKFLLKL